MYSLGDGVMETLKEKYNHFINTPTKELNEMKVIKNMIGEEIRVWKDVFWKKYYISRDKHARDEFRSEIRKMKEKYPMLLIPIGGLYITYKAESAEEDKMHDEEDMSSE